MLRFALILVATAMLTSACFLIDDPACACKPPLQRVAKAEQVAGDFARSVSQQQSGKRAWTLLNTAAQRHYGNEQSFARRRAELAKDLSAGFDGSGFGGAGNGAHWVTVGQAASRRNGISTELLIPVGIDPDRPPVGRVALPVDSGIPATTEHRIGVPQAANLSIRTPDFGAIRPPVGLVLPKGGPVTITLLPAARPYVTAQLQRTYTAEAIRARARETRDGYEYKWRPEPGVGPGNYALVVSAERGGKWSWNAVPITVGR
jgi:hypothetical protein